ncbi:MAG: prohibitin family protein [Clostridiales bacterium]|nr:prohibitin family protein [Clostridiales bacterium]
MLKIIKRTSIAFVALIIVIILAANSFTTVPVGSTGILLTMGRIEEGKALSEGLHFKIPFVQKIVSLDNRVKKLELTTEAFSKDIQTVSATLAVNYQLQAQRSFDIYKKHGTQYEQNILVPATHEVLKSVCAQYTAEELISKRAESSDKMRDELDTKLNSMGITITDFNIIDFDFSEEYISAVESKQVAEQLKKKAATENETAIAQAEREKQVSIKQSEAEAERVKIEAEAKAASRIIEAQAEADAVKLAAEAEAYRLSTIGEYITEDIINKTISENWDGKLPTVVGTGTAGILDIASLMEDDSPEIVKPAQ